MRRVAVGLALLLVMSACTAAVSESPSSTTTAPETTTSVPSTTTTAAPPQTTTTTPDDVCSASGGGWVLEDQPGLPTAVAEKRAAVFAAAVTCDFDELERLAGPGGGFAGPVGNGVHPGTAEAFRDAESRQPYENLWWLLTTLNLPYAERSYTYGDGSEWHGYVWPAAQGMDWADIPAEEAAELRDLYTWREEYNGDMWDQGQFFGFKVMITPEGTWVWVGHTPA